MTKWAQDRNRFSACNKLGVSPAMQLSRSNQTSGVWRLAAGQETPSQALGPAALDYDGAVSALCDIIELANVGSASGLTQTDTNLEGNASGYKQISRIASGVVLMVKSTEAAASVREPSPE